MTQHQLANKTVLIITPSLTALAFLTPLTLALHRENVSVHFASSSNGFSKVEIPPHINFHDIDMERGANISKHLAAAKSLHRLVQEIKPDLVDVHYSAAMITVAMARKKNWPCVIATVQGLRFPHSKGIAKIIDLLAELGAATRMNQVSILTKCDLIAAKRFFGKNFRLQKSLGFGCNLERFNPRLFTEQNRSLLREKLGIAPSTVVCIYVGRYVKFKGFGVALRAFWEANKFNSDMHLLLCGTLDPLHESGVSEQEITNIESDEKITDLGWNPNVEKYLSISDICIFPSEREGVPVSLMEALSMGVPVITSDSRGCRDAVTDQKNGFILPIGKTSLYAEKLVELANNRQTLKRLSVYAYENRSKFDSKHFAEESLIQYQANIVDL